VFQYISIGSDIASYRTAWLIKCWAAVAFHAVFERVHSPKLTLTITIHK
jgi:hypothetical protein